MNKIFFLSVLLLTACAHKKVELKKFEYLLGTYAKINMDHVKQRTDTIEVILLGISVGGEEVAIKNKDLECGIADQTFKDVELSEDFVILPRPVFKEFSIICEGITPIPEEGTLPYIVFKKIYSVKDNAPDKLLHSNIKIQLK